MKNILVFPCGSEVGLEIYRSMKFSRHFHLIGGSSVNDHGRFVFDDYIGGIPFHNNQNFIQVLAEIVKKKQIEAIFPAMDSVALTIKENEHKIGCHVIGSSLEATATCASKEATYTKIGDQVPLPEWYASIDDVRTYPIFIKPDVGYGARDVYLAQNKMVAQEFIATRSFIPKFIYCEYLPGAEYTVDCFSNRHGQLLFAGARERSRISNGISTNTKIVGEFVELYENYAKIINKVLKPRGAWFYQMKKDKNGGLKLLEIATRLAGSSSLYRGQGLNFALMSSFDTFDIDISVLKNSYEIELDRALSNKYSLKIEYHTVYMDYDDCLIIDSKINIEMIGFIFSSINAGKKLVLITRHSGDIYQSLEKYRISNLFDEVVHIKNKDEPKSEYIKPYGAIFIDDSHVERAAVLARHQIPVFSPDMVETLI